MSDTWTGTDLPREPGTIYARITERGRQIEIVYSEAYSLWKAGVTVYTKNSNGYARDVARRPWEPLSPHPSTEEKNDA
jgi:hypothetical protein